MPHHIWFEASSLKHNARHRRIDVVNKFLQSGASLRGTPSVANYRKIDNAASSGVTYGNYCTKLYNLSDIAQIYGLSPSTVSRWYNKGMLPEAFLYNAGGKASWGNRIPYYTKQQVLVICKVLDDIFRQSSCQFRQDHYKHIQMMRDGCLIAIQRIPYKACMSA